MRDMLKAINARHHEALSRLFVVQVAIVAACFLVAMDGPGPVTPFLFLLSLFVWPLVAAWPARTGRLLRGAVTNALLVLFIYADSVFWWGWPISQYILKEFFTVLAFGMVSGMAAGGLVERRRSRQRALSAGQPRSTQLPPPSVTAYSYFNPAEFGCHASEHATVLPAKPGAKA